jgi:hypothetical protein
MGNTSNKQSSSVILLKSSITSVTSARISPTVARMLIINKEAIKPFQLSPDYVIQSTSSNVATNDGDDQQVPSNDREEERQSVQHARRSKPNTNGLTAAGMRFGSMLMAVSALRLPSCQLKLRSLSSNIHIKKPTF